MFYRKVADQDFETATLSARQGSQTRISGYGRAFFVPDIERPNEIEVIFECAPEEAETIEAQEGWLFEGAAAGGAGSPGYRVRVPVRFDSENASHTAPKKQLKLVWDGGDFHAEPSVEP